MDIELLLLLATVLFTSFATGIFLDYSVSINRALKQVGNREYVEVMQHINTTIERNGFFLISFMAPVFLLPLVTILYGGGFGTLKFSLLAFASLIYIVGMFGITMGRNVPLNRWLAQLPIKKASDKELADARSRYETPWDRFHNTRTLAGMIASLLVAWAAML